MCCVPSTPSTPTGISNFVKSPPPQRNPYMRGHTYSIIIIFMYYHIIIIPYGGWCLNQARRRAHIIKNEEWQYSSHYFCVACAFNVQPPLEGRYNNFNNIIDNPAGVSIWGLCELLGKRFLEICGHCTLSTVLERSRLFFYLVVVNAI